MQTIYALVAQAIYGSIFPGQECVPLNVIFWLQNQAFIQPEFVSKLVFIGSGPKFRFGKPNQKHYTFCFV